jgi:predicted RNase H-like nuclease (RuvC/YqgF family)
LLNTFTVSPSFSLTETKILPPIKQVDSDINLFIPLETVPPPNPQLHQLQQKINELEQIKKQEDSKLSEMKKTVQPTEEKYQEYLEEKAKLDNLKKELKQDQEKWEEIEKKFEADKKLYFIFKNEIATEQRSENNIPILFKDTYPIFKQLDEESKLNNDEEIKHYLELTKYYKNTVFMTSEFDDLFLNN